MLEVIANFHVSSYCPHRVPWQSLVIAHESNVEAMFGESDNLTACHHSIGSIMHLNFVAHEQMPPYTKTAYLA